jgi:serine protease Do
MKINVTLGTRPGGVEWNQRNRQGGNDQEENNDSTGNAAVRGISVETLTPDAAQQIGLPSNVHGVVIDNVDADSPAADKVARGLVVTAVDRHPVNNVEEFKRLMSQAEGKSVLLTVVNPGPSGAQTGFTVVPAK